MEKHEDEVMKKIEDCKNSSVEEEDVQHQSEVVCLFYCPNEILIVNNSQLTILVSFFFVFFLCVCVKKCKVYTVSVRKERVYESEQKRM